MEIVVEARDEPGVLAHIGEMFGKVEVNILAAAAFTFNGKGIIHFVVDDADKAIGVLKETKNKVLQVREVLSVSLDDRPGELGRFARRMADAGVNITSFYTAGASGGDAELIIAVDDLEAARDRLKR